jgi:hypothetical protein
MMQAVIKVLSLTCFILIFATCDKNENGTDYAAIIEGTYTGTVITGTSAVPGTTEIVRFTDTKADMHIAAGTHTLNIYGIRITSSGNDVYYLSYAIAGNTLDGNVEGNLLTYTLSSGTLDGTFTGLR